MREYRTLNKPSDMKRGYITFMKRSFFTMAAIMLALLSLAMAACSSTSFKENPVGYNHLINQTLSPTPKAHTITVPTTKDTTPMAHLRAIGMGTTPISFVGKYGQPLPISQPPTQYVFQTGLDPFPQGSEVVVSFDLGKDNTIPRAVQISFTAGNAHPTTYAQARAIAEGFLPDDLSAQTTVQTTNNTNQCQVVSYTSNTLAQLFPAQDFEGPNGGDLAKPGTVSVSFFPLLNRWTDSNGTPAGEDQIVDGKADGNQISSILITLGNKPYC